VNPLQRRKEMAKKKAIKGTKKNAKKAVKEAKGK
jgi:hypothetical protein